MINAYCRRTEARLLVVSIEGWHSILRLAGSRDSQPSSRITSLVGAVGVESNEKLYLKDLRGMRW